MEKATKKLSQTEFNTTSLELIINTVSLFSMIEHPAFIKYCQSTSNKVPVSRRNFMRDVSSLFDNMIQQLKIELSDINYVCTTADCWRIFHRFINFFNYQNLPFFFHNNINNVNN